MKKIIAFTFLILNLSNLLAQNASVIYKNNVNSTVTIETDNGSLGSGFFVAPYIIATNYHVIDGATSASCFLNNSNVKYEIEGYVGVDKITDLVLLKVSKLTKPSIKISKTKVAVGQKVFVMGSPKGLSSTISEGIVSGLRDIEGYKLIQMTAPISPGSSGGPVLNSLGELIGISVLQMKEGQNLNFSIPVSYLQILIDFKKETPALLSELIEIEEIEPINNQTEEEALEFISFYSNEWGCEKYAKGTVQVRLQYQIANGKLIVKEYLPNFYEIEYLREEFDLSKIKSFQFDNGKGCNSLIIRFYEDGFKISIKYRGVYEIKDQSSWDNHLMGEKHQWSWDSIRLYEDESQKERADRLINAFKFLANKYGSVLKESGF
jgi:hypothetical protein